MSIAWAEPGADEGGGANPSGGSKTLEYPAARGGEREVWEEDRSRLAGVRKAAIACARMAAVEALSTCGERERRPLERERVRLERLSRDLERRERRSRDLERLSLERERRLVGWSRDRERDLDRRSRRECVGDWRRAFRSGEREGDLNLRSSNTCEDAEPSEDPEPVEDSDDEVDGDRSLFLLAARSSAKRRASAAVPETFFFFWEEVGARTGDTFTRGFGCVESWGVEVKGFFWADLTVDFTLEAPVTAAAPTVRPFGRPSGAALGVCCSPKAVSLRRAAVTSA